jgi:drug/metabolite transporter (DMT)-like permease
LITDLLLLLVAISWGATFVLVQKAIVDIPVFIFLSLRFFLAFLFMFIIFFKKLEYNIASIKAAIILGIINFLVFSFQTFGLLYTSSSIVAFITGLYVILTPVTAFLFFKKSISKYAIIGTILATIGLYYLTLSDNLTFGAGEFLTFLCAVFVAFHINFTDIYSKKYNVFTLVTFQFLTIALLSIIFIPFEKGNIKFSKEVITALTVTVLFATVFAYFVQTYAQKFTSSTKTAVIFAMEPVSAAILGYCYGEQLTAKQLFGAFLVVTAMIVTETGEVAFKKMKEKVLKLLNKA